MGNAQAIDLNGPDSAKTASAIADEIIEVCGLGIGCRGTIASAIHQARVDGARFAMSDLCVSEDVQAGIVLNIGSRFEAVPPAFQPLPDDVFAATKEGRS